MNPFPKTRRWGVSALAIASVLTMSTAGCGRDGSGDAGGDGNVVTIGELGHFSGFAAAPYGEPFDKGFKAGLEAIEESGELGDYELKLETTDVVDQVPAAVTSFNKFDRDGISVFVGAILSPIARALTPIVNDADALLVSGAGASGEEDNVFYLSDAMTPHIAFAESLVEEGHTRFVSIVEADNPSFGLFADNFEKGVTDAGGELISRESISASDNNFSALLSDIAREKPDVVFVSALGEQSGNLFSQMRQVAGLEDVQIAGTVTWQKEVFETAGDAAVGAKFPLYWAPGSANDADFTERYVEKYDEQPTTYSGLGYQAAWLIAASVLEADAQGKSIDGAGLASVMSDAASSELIKKYGVVTGYTLPPSGIPTYPGVVVEFDDSGEIVTTNGS